MRRDAREDLRGSAFFAATAEFCELHDQMAFDPRYRTLPLEYFEPIVEAYFRRFNSLDSLRIDASEWRAPEVSAA